MKPTIYTSAFSKKHDTGHAHPECPARIEVLEDLLQEKPFKDWPQKQSTAAELDQILLAHTEEYVFDLQDTIPEQGLMTRDNETIFSPDSYDAALHAAGAVCQAIDDILSEETPGAFCAERPPACGHDGLQNAKAFCAIRPPGHHAEPSHELGFCLFNNIFIGARHAQEKYDLKKIAIVDFDVHHGNGTETMCRKHNKAYPDQPVLYISSHGFPLFPMTGDPADNNDTLLNIRLPDGCTSDQFRALYEEQVFPALNNFQPELLMLSSGFDAHKDDPLAPMKLETADYGWLTRWLCDIAEKHAKGRIVSVLEGGYHLNALKECVRAHLNELILS